MKKKTLLISVLCIVLVLAMSIPTIAWLASVMNSVNSGIDSGFVVQQYFHCGNGTKDNPFVITRPIHYYHLVELYLRYPTGFASIVNSQADKGEPIYFQLGYDFGDGTRKVYKYDEFGNTDNSYSDTLNMLYYSGDLSLIPIGTSEHPFDAVFDGSGLTISNLSIRSAENIIVYDENNKREVIAAGSSDIGIFGYVNNTDGKALIKNAYFTNITISLDGADCAYGKLETSKTTTVHTENNVCIGTVIGHLYNYTNAKVRDYYTNLAGTDAAPIANVYVNNVTVTGGTVSGTTAICDYGLVGYVENVDEEKAQSIRKNVETAELYGDGDESWGGSIDMTELFTRVTEIITGSESSSNRYYPTAETIIQSASASGTPSVTMTSKSTDALRSNYGSVYYWSAERVAGIGNESDMTGGAIFGTDSGNEWNYLYGLAAAQTTATTTYSKTGAIVTAYYLYDNGAYLSFDGTTVSGKKSAKDAVKLIPESESEDTANGLTSAKYYILIDNKEYSLTTNGTTGISFISGKNTGVTWIKNDIGEFYTVIGGTNYYLAFDGSWTLSGSSTRFSITDGTHYLSATTDGVIDEKSANESYIWTATKGKDATDATKSCYYFYFESAGKKYYLYVKDGELGVCEEVTGQTYGWRITETDEEGKMKLSATVGGIVYYLCYDNGWKATINGYTISFGDKYIKATLNGVSTANASNATVFQLQGEGSNTKLVVPINGVAHYLTSVGETLQLSDTETTWTKTADNKFYRYVTYTGDAAILNKNYYICYDNGWKVCPESGYYFGATADSQANYMAIDQDNAIINTQSEDNAAIWQFAQSNSRIATLIGETVYYLNYNENGIYLSESSLTWSLTWNKQGSSFYLHIGTFYNSEDRIHLGFLENHTWGTYIDQNISGDSTKYSFTICDPTLTHYLTYSLKNKTVTGGVTNYLAVDGSRNAACTWIIKETENVVESLKEVVIYTYIGTTRYFLSEVEGTLCVSSTESKWLKTETGKHGYSKNGYYLSFETPIWTLIDLTATIKLNYKDSANASHYLFTNGTGLGVATEAGIANNFNYSSTDHQLYTIVGTTKYYLTYEVKTIKEKTNDESNAVINAYRKIVPTVTTTKPSITWGVNDEHYYLTLNDVEFYLYFDEESYSWQLQEIGGYQIKQGSSYLTLKETPEDLSKDTILFTVGQLCRSATPNYQWHINIINKQLFTFIGDVPYYITYTSSNKKAQILSLTTSKPSSDRFGISETKLYKTISNVEFCLSYVDGGITLPSEYTRIEYLESTGNQIIDTGVADATNITIDCDVEALSTSATGQYLFGSTQKGGWGYNGLYRNTDGSISLDFAFKYSPKTTASRVQMAQTLSNNTVTVAFNGTTIDSYDIGTATPTGNIYIFGCNDGTRFFGTGMRVYRFTIKQNNTDIRDFIPVVNSSGTAGLYDLIEGTFYSFSFIGGGTSSLEAETVNAMKYNGFTALEYLKSTGNQIINTGVADATDITIDCDVEVQSARTTGQYLFGSTQKGGWGYNGLYRNTDGSISLDFAFKYSPKTTASRVQMTQTLSDNQVTVVLNGNSNGPYDIGSASPTGNIYIFGCNDGTRFFGTDMKVYRFTIYKAGTAIRDFVPAKRDSDGVYGLYDLVEGKFYENANQTNNNFATGASLFYMIPASGYASIASGNTYMTLTSSTTVGSATKNASNLYEYQHFIITENGTGYNICLGNTNNYLTTNGALGTGSTIAEKGTLTYTTDTTKAIWYKDGSKYYQVVDSTNYYLVFDSVWKASPSRVEVNFRYILSNGKYMILNSAKTGIATATTLVNTSEYHRWFVDGSKLYTQVGSDKYYLTWSETAGFSVSKNSGGTALTIPTSTTASIKIYGTDLYIVNDDSGWNVSISGGNYIYSGSSYINATSATAVAIQSSGKTRWRTANNKVYSYYAGKIVYWTTTNGSSISLTNSSSGSTAWTVSGGQYSTVYNGTTYYLYLNGSTLSLTGPKGYFIYALIVPTYTNGPDHSYMYHPSNTETSPKNMNTSSMTEALGGLWTVSGNLIYFTYTSGKNTITRYLTYTSSSSPVSSESGTSFYLGSSTNNVTWSYDATTHRLKMTKGSITGYVALRIANNSIQGWKLYSNDTTDSIKKSDNKTTGNYFDVYMDPVYDTNNITSFSSSSQTSVDNVLKTGQYVSGIDPQNLTYSNPTKKVYAFGSAITTVSSTVPAVENQESRTTTNLVTNSYKSGNRYIWSPQTFATSALTVTQYTSAPVVVYVLTTNANPTVTLLKDQEQLYTSSTTNYKRGTYIPIKAAYQNEAGTEYYDDYHASDRNTGYIVGGAYSSKSGSGQGDIRISEYGSGNISGSYNRSYGTLSSLYTFNDSGITRINDSANAYVNYEYTKEKFLEILSLNKSSVYGLHFMNSQISTSRTMYAESVRVLGKTYVNYQLPESSIDFNVYEQGYIVLYAGDYYNGNNCFFSLHKVFRDSNQAITDIKEISEVYTKEDIKSYEHYIYKFTDGTYTNANGSYTGATTLADGYNTTPVFKMKWLTNPTDGKSFSNDYIYYFEIPCNSGEYCLGSVSAPSGSSTTYDGGYLLYLDIATNGIHGTTYNQIAKISSDPLLTQMGYYDPSDTSIYDTDGSIKKGSLPLNSLLNIGYMLPEGNTTSNFSITVSYSYTDIIHDEKYDTDCTVFTINIKNTTGNMMNLYVLLLDDDDDATNPYLYRYRIVYNGSDYIDSTAYDPSTEVYYATASFTLPPATS